MEWRKPRLLTWDPRRGHLSILLSFIRPAGNARDGRLNSHIALPALVMSRADFLRLSKRREIQLRVEAPKGEAFMLGLGYKKLCPELGYAVRLNHRI